MLSLLAKFPSTSSVACRCLSTTAATAQRRVTVVPRVVPDRAKDEEQYRIDNYGYSYHYYKRGDRYGRIKQTPKQEVPPIQGRVVEEYNDEDPQWTPENALLGRNDYIDLLGDGSVHPAQLLYHQPPWLRGFPGVKRASELHRLLHYRNLYARQMKANSPQRWHQLTKRIAYLLKYHNYRKQHKLGRERDLGLWNEEPDFYHKENVRRSYDDGEPYAKF